MCFRRWKISQTSAIIFYAHFIFLTFNVQTLIGYSYSSYLNIYTAEKTFTACWVTCLLIYWLANASKYTYHLQQIHAEQHFFLSLVYQPDFSQKQSIMKVKCAKNVKLLLILENSACFKDNVLHRPRRSEGTLWLKLWIPDRNIKPIMFFRRSDMSVLFILFFLSHTGAVFTHRSTTNEIILISLLFFYTAIDYTVQMESVAFTFWLLVIPCF